MGTARGPVAGSGDWPAWTARVAKWRCSSDIFTPWYGLRFDRVSNWSLEPEVALRGLKPKTKARILEDPGRFCSFKIVCAYRIRFTGARRRGPIMHIHM